MAASPPSHTGRCGLTSMPVTDNSTPKTIAITSDWQNTSRALSVFPAPKNCAAWTEKPVTAETQRPPKSHDELATSPIAADASAPRLPTIAASIYCMIIELISARIAGMLSLTTSIACCLRVSFCILVICIDVPFCPAGFCLSDVFTAAPWSVCFRSDLFCCRHCVSRPVSSNTSLIAFLIIYPRCSNIIPHKK